MKVLCCIVGLWSAIIGVAQGQMSELLSFPISEEEMGLVLAREEYLATHKFNSPWLRELDFRIRPNTEETAISDYRLRFGILNPFEMRANRSYHQLLVSQQGFEQKKTINNVLKRRYQLILEGTYLTRALKINQTNLDQLREIAAISVEEGADLADLIKLEEDITKQELRIKEIERNMKQLLPAYQALGLDSLSAFASHEWVSQDQLMTILIEQGGGESLELQSEQQQLARRKSMLEINKAEAFSNLGFIQAEYDTRGNDTRDEQLSFQLGFNIPIFNTDRPDNQRRELNLIEDEVEYKQQVQEEAQDRTLQSTELLDYLAEWQLLEEKQEKLAVYRATVEEVGGEVETYDRLRSYTYFLADRTLQVEVDVYRRYIDQLAEVGALSDQPYQNFLSATLESFQVIGE